VAVLVLDYLVELCCGDELANRTLTAVFPKRTSSLHAYLHQQSVLVHSGPGSSAFDSLHIPGPSVVQVVYWCKFLRCRGVGNLAVSVLAATFGMFSTLWTVYITVVGWIKGDELLEPDRNRKGRLSTSSPCSSDSQFLGVKPNYSEIAEVGEALTNDLATTSTRCD
jgi:hypothetical protein